MSTLFGLIIGLLIGILLDKLPGFTGYAVVFSLAGAFGAFDICCYFFMKVKPMTATEKKEGIFQMMRDVLRDKRYMTTVLALTAWVFTVQLSSPYFNVYLRSRLGVSNFDIILTGQIANNALLILLVSRWGRAIDRYGNRPVLLVAAFLAAVTPLWWLRVDAGMLALIAFANAWSGGIYCAVDLTLQNLFMMQAKPTNRSMYFAVYFIFTQLFGFALGSTVGGILLDNALMSVDNANILLAGVAFTRYNALFLVSAVLRFIVVFALLPRIREDDSQPARALITDGRVALLHNVNALRYGIKRRIARRNYHKNKENN